MTASPRRLLGCPILGAADERTIAIALQRDLVDIAPQHVGKPKVGNADLPIVAIEDVAGLEVAVRHATGMRMRESPRDREPDRSHLGPGQRRLRRSPYKRAAAAMLLHEKRCR